MRQTTQKQTPKEILLDNILAFMEGETFGKTTAAKIVGGEGRLLTLIAQGEIEVNKTSEEPNGRWNCNAAQVLQHISNKRRKVKPIKTA